MTQTIHSRPRSRTSKPARSRTKTRSKPVAGDETARRVRKPAKAVRRERTEPTARTAKAPVKQHLPVYREARSPQSKNKAHCTACGLCCSYVAIEVDAPDTVKRATQLLWYVYHEGVSLYANGDDWMVQFDSTCVHLQPDYRCGIYDTRPHICREFDERDCEVNTGDDGHTFYTASEFMAHLKQIHPRVYGFVRKHFAPPDESPRTRPEPFEQRFRAVMSRRQALPPS